MTGPSTWIGPPPRRGRLSRRRWTRSRTGTGRRSSGSRRSCTGRPRRGTRRSTRRWVGRGCRRTATRWPRSGSSHPRRRNRSRRRSTGCGRCRRRSCTGRSGSRRGTWPTGAPSATPGWRTPGRRRRSSAVPPGPVSGQPHPHAASQLLAVGVGAGEALGFLLQGGEHDLRVDPARGGDRGEHRGDVLVGAAGVGGAVGVGRLAPAWSAGGSSRTTGCRRRSRCRAR